MANNSKKPSSIDKNSYEEVLTTVNDHVAKLQKEREKELANYKLKLAQDIEKKLSEQQLKDAKLLAELKKKSEQQAQKLNKLEQEKNARDIANLDKKYKLELYKQQKEYAKQLAEEEKEYKQYALGEKIGDIISKVLTNSGGTQKGDNAEEVGNALGQALAEILNKTLVKTVDESIDKAMNLYSQYSGKITSRLDGTDKTFKALMDSNSKMSPFYETKTYVSKLNDLVDKGIAYNVEQRAFLSTISEKIVTTFDATNGTLLRLIRLQQADSTSTRMGMESALNEFLNSQYYNTEYLSDAYDKVAESLVEATSTMTAETAIEFEYVVQKWLGSLYSVGLSTNTVTSLATALGNLGSGNVSALSGTGMGNLLALATARSGELSYSDLLANGVNSNQVDTLMQSIVGYMQDIALSSNNVVKNQLAELFGVSISDLTAAGNIDIQTLADTANLTASQSYSALTSKMKNMYSLDNILNGTGAVTIKEAVDNMVNNALINMGAGIADNAVQYGLYKAADLVGDLTEKLGDKVSDINKVASMIKTGVLISSGIENLLDVVAGNSSLGFDMVGTMEKLAESGTGLWSKFGQRGATVSQKATSKNGVIEIKSGSGKSADEYKIEAQEDTEKQEKITNAPLEVQQYLLNTFDKKMDTLLQLTAYGSNYSVYGVGKYDSSTIESLMGGNSVKIIANTSDDTKDLTTSISENVSNIYSLLLQVVNGERSFATISALGTQNGVVNTASKYIGG